MSLEKEQQKVASQYQHVIEAFLIKLAYENSILYVVEEGRRKTDGLNLANQIKN